MRYHGLKLNRHFLPPPFKGERLDGTFSNHRRIVDFSEGLGLPVEMGFSKLSTLDRHRMGDCRVYRIDYWSACRMSLYLGS